ncbi:MAG: EAL domain-containing protein, partial [Bryobacteraceae bacterium]
AEDTGLIARVGAWVLREACAQMVRWRASGHMGLRVSVNVSTLQLMKSDFADGVKAILLRTGLDPDALSLEITETAMMRTWDQSRSQMEQLRALGINIALDDFGTGYSTLNSLQLLPLDYIKIDRSFTERIGDKADGLVVIRAIVDLAHKLGFEVIAEGVETPEQLAGLTSIGCDLLQGFLLGPPLSADEAGRLLASTSNLTDAEESLRSLARWTSPAIGQGALGD